MKVELKTKEGIINFILKVIGVIAYLSLIAFLYICCVIFF